MTQPKTQVTLINGGGGVTYAQSVSAEHLPPGIYRLTEDPMNFGFQPIVADNDPPLEVDQTVTETIAELEDFLSRPGLYAKFGFNHKRGYLFHGPPGCGKSSALRLLEQRFIQKFGGLVLVANPRQQVQNWFELVRQYEPTRPVMVVCEDIDAALAYFETYFLEFLDGQKGLNNFVLVSTTNYLDRIPDRIKNRPSRIDRLIEIKLPNHTARVAYLTKIGLEPDKAQLVSTSSEGLSMAALKEVVIGTECLGQPLAQVLRRLRGLTGDDLQSNPELADEGIEDDSDDDDMPQEVASTPGPLANISAMLKAALPPV